MNETPKGGFKASKRISSSDSNKTRDQRDSHDTYKSEGHLRTALFNDKQLIREESPTLDPATSASASHGDNGTLKSSCLVDFLEAPSTTLTTQALDKLSLKKTNSCTSDSSSPDIQSPKEDSVEDIPVPKSSVPKYRHRSHIPGPYTLTRDYLLQSRSAFWASLGRYSPSPIYCSYPELPMYATMNPSSYNPSAFYYSSLTPASASSAAGNPTGALGGAHSHLTHPLSAYVGTPHVQTAVPQQSHSYSNYSSRSQQGSVTNRNGYSGDSSEHNGLGMSSSNTSPQNGSLIERTSRTNLYIKGLSEDFTDQRLKELVPDINQVKSVKAATEDDNKCRGYGFIDFHSEDAAQIALRHIQQHHDGYTIKFAKENEKDKTNLYVTNIPKSWTTKDSDQLKDLFSKYGQIQSAFIMVEKSTNRATGFVRFANEEDAQRALDGIKACSQVLSGCTAPLEAKFADKHNPESRRRKNVPQLNGGVRGSLTTPATFPLLTSPGTTSYTPNMFYGATNLYRQSLAAAPAASYSSFQLAYPNLTGQSLIPGSNFYMPSVTNQSSAAAVQSATLQALSGHNNGATDANPLSSTFGHHVFLANGGLTSPGLTYAHGLDYATHGAYPYAVTAAQPHSNDHH